MTAERKKAQEKEDSNGEKRVRNYEMSKSKEMRRSKEMRGS